MDVCTDRLFKVLVIGDTCTGKTSLVLRYANRNFREDYKTTIGVDFVLKTVQWDPRTVVRLQFWDIAGQDQTRSLSRVFYKEASAALVVLDASDWTTLDSAAAWKRDLDSKVSRGSGQPIPALLLANKCDLMQQADRERLAPSLDDFCKHNQFMGWFYTSAKENINVEEAGSFLIEQIMVSSSDELQPNEDEVIKVKRRSAQRIGALCC